MVRLSFRWEERSCLCGEDVTRLIGEAERVVDFLWEDDLGAVSGGEEEATCEHEIASSHHIAFEREDTGEMRRGAAITHPIPSPSPSHLTSFIARRTSSHIHLLFSCHLLFYKWSTPFST